jgi:uncharacterized glyoxalase superfamily protein PhnB
MLKKLTPNLMVEDVKQTLQWYGDVLGFQTLTTVPETGDVLDWAMAACDGVTLMFQSRRSLGGEISVLADVPVGASQTFYVEVEGLDGLYQSLKDRVKVVYNLHTTFYGSREFYFTDCNGYIIGFSEAAT